MTTLLIAAASFLFLSFGILALILSLTWLRRDDLSGRLQTYVVEDIEPTRRLLGGPTAIRRELAGPFLNRTLLPFFKNIGQFLGRLTPAHSMEDLKRQLLVAGSPLGLGPREFYGLRIAFMLLAIVMVFLVLQKGVTQINLLLAVLIAILCYLYPTMWLRSAARRRQNKIRKGLPDALDMLSVCADAGLGFDQSMLRVSESWKTPISLELGRVVAEMEMGVSRRDALRSMADRLEVPELSSFVSVILQSEQIGMSIADTLHAQAEQMRVERRFRAQEQARTIPIKMLVPLAFLIFPAIMAVILGPAIPQLMDLFGSF